MFASGVASEHVTVGFLESVCLHFTLDSNSAFVSIPDGLLDTYSHNVPTSGAEHLGSGGAWRLTARPPSGDRQVVQEQEPFTVEPSHEHDEHELLEIFRPIGRSKSQPLRKILTRWGHDSHLGL